MSIATKIEDLTDNQRDNVIKGFVFSIKKDNHIYILSL